VNASGARKMELVEVTRTLLSLSKAIMFMV
jgi:hypothetical protein